MRVSSMKKKIETRRGIFKSQMEDLEHRLKENALQLELCAHSKEISNLYEQLDSLQTEFEEELEAEESEKERQTWKGLRMSLMDLRAQVESSMEVEEPTNSVNREVRQVHLPRYELEKFDGDVTRFREFWDQFEDQVELDDTVRGTKELRLESKRSTRAMGKLGNSGKGTETQRTMAFFHSAVELSCALCHEQHTIAECMKFRQASRQRNKEIAARFQICFSCFKPGHISIGCKSRRRRSGPSSKDNNSVTPVDTATAERVQEIPTAECKSSDVSMLQANLD
ncbi:Gag polyprotein [Trichinella pseudospiralis]